MKQIHKRLQVLEERREKLILLNNREHYTQIGNANGEKYMRLLNLIRNEKGTLLSIREKEHAKTPLGQFFQASKGANGFQILMSNFN